MKIRITDIPPQGRELDFPLSGLNGRLARDKDGGTPDYIFVGEQKVHVKLNLEGRTVFLEGKGQGVFQTTCARCAEEVQAPLQVPISRILKPTSSRPQDDVEDLQLGYYDGKEVDCAEVAEEQFVLALPYTVLCKPDCKGLCPSCGANLNLGGCACNTKRDGEAKTTPFAALQNLKLT